MGDDSNKKNPEPVDDSMDERDFVTDKTSIVASDTLKLRLAQAGQAPPSVVLLVGPAAIVGRQWAVEDTNLIIGRVPSAHIYVDERSVSKAHAKITLSGSDVSITDLESTNKTLINGQAIAPLQPQVLKNNDQIKCGNVIFKFLERGNLESVASAQTFDRSQTDALTGIANRGAFNQRIVEFFKRSKLLNVPLSLVIFDIDHFKPINDNFGHPVGDMVLKELTSVIRAKLIRENDFFARIGGEEFCLAILGSPIKSAEEIAGRLRQTVEAMHIMAGDTIIPVTISLGVSARREEDEDWTALYQRADKALYLSKNTGRNRVSVAP